jgi:hypothetical protein
MSEISASKKREKQLERRLAFLKTIQIPMSFQELGDALREFESDEELQLYIPERDLEIVIYQLKSAARCIHEIIDEAHFQRGKHRNEGKAA